MNSEPLYLLNNLNPGSSSSASLVCQPLLALSLFTQPGLCFVGVKWFSLPGSVLCLLVSHTVCPWMVYFIHPQLSVPQHRSLISIFAFPAPLLWEVPHESLCCLGWLSGSPFNYRLVLPFLRHYLHLSLWFSPLCCPCWGLAVLSAWESRDYLIPVLILLPW